MVRWDRLLWGDERPSMRGWLIGLVPAALILALVYWLTDSTGLQLAGSLLAAVVLRVVAYTAAPRRISRGPWT